MAYEIRWSENAREDLEEIFDYLVSEWSVNVAEDFLIKCLSKIDLISNFPFLGPESEKVKDYLNSWKMDYLEVQILIPTRILESDIIKER